MADRLFSIITITKNNASGLRLTAKSLSVQQQFSDYEWIVIDGASTDHTAQIIDEYKAETTTFISEPDHGIYDAMNKGIDRATGKYLWFLNAGDCLPDAFTLRDLAREIGKTAAPHVLYGDARENGVIKRAHDVNTFAWGMFTHHQAIVYRRDIVSDLRFDTDYKISADYAFTLNMLAKAERVHHYPRILCDFQIGGISQQHAALGRTENFHIRRDLLQMHPIKNKAIYALNATTWILRQNLPFFYRLARIFLRK